MEVSMDRWNLPYTGPGYSNSSNLDIQTQGNIILETGVWYLERWLSLIQN